MEGAGHKGRWNKKAPVGIILFLMWMLFPTVALPQSSEEEQCPDGDFWAGKGICCNKCNPGSKLVEICPGTGRRSNCTRCPAGQYNDEINYSRNCRRCIRCKREKHEIEVSSCKSHQNTICKCIEGYYRITITSETHDCLKCKQCGPNELLKQPCTPENNTVCECKENYYRVKKKCEPCKSCTSECKHLCLTSPPPRSSKVPNEGNEFLVNLTAVIVVVAVVLLVLGILITHFATKWFTKKKLQELSSQPSDVSQDSCQQVLISDEGTWDTSIVKAIPQSPVGEQEPFKLPDCVPLEIHIPDLIYTVLDLVPVQQVKQLVRTLGVTDTEIEQAETDHRSCREAHYQMMRVWAERGSRACGGGRGKMLPSPFLQELLQKLKMMHLGQAVEELVTKYNIH